MRDFIESGIFECDGDFEFPGAVFYSFNRSDVHLRRFDAIVQPSKFGISILWDGFICLGRTE